MRYSSIILLGIVATILFGYPLTGFSQSQDKTLIKEVSLTVEAPFSTANITINDQGLILYRASSPDTGISEINETSRISREQYNELAGFIISSDFFSLKDEYREDNLADATTYILTVKKDNLIKSVSCYGNCPGRILGIINKIKALWGKDILEVGI